MSKLHDDIAAFLEMHKMAESAFGELARGDRHFVRQLRAGRRVWPETEQAVRDFMEAYPKHEPWVPKPRQPIGQAA